MHKCVIISRTIGEIRECLSGSNRKKKKKCMDDGKHENIGNKRKKLNNKGNIGDYVNIMEL